MIDGSNNARSNPTVPLEPTEAIPNNNGSAAPLVPNSIHSDKGNTHVSAPSHLQNSREDSAMVPSFLGPAINQAVIPVILPSVVDLPEMVTGIQQPPPTTDVALQSRVAVHDGCNSQQSLTDSPPLVPNPLTASHACPSHLVTHYHKEASMDDINIRPQCLPDKQFRTEGYSTDSTTTSLRPEFEHEIRKQVDQWQKVS